MTSLCPSCWREVDAEAHTCRHCGADIERLSQRDYTDKLIGALRHFEPGTVMHAAAILASRRDQSAVGPLAETARRHWEDPYICSAVVRALGGFVDARASNVVSQALTHPSVIVRRAAEQIVRDSAR